MVPLEERIGYLARIGESTKLAAFNNLLLTNPVFMPQHSDLNENEEIYFGILKSIQANNKSDFEKYYAKKSKSKPGKDSPAPFVNDDFLIFSFIVGIAKFNIDKTWINHIVSVRSRNITTATFENILNENYYSTSNAPEVVFMFLQLTNQLLITNEFVSFAYKKVADNNKLLDSRSDFQILCSLRTYDSILLLKELPDKQELQALKVFNARFVDRIKYLSWLLQIALFGGLIYLLLNLPQYGPEAVSFIEKYNYAFTILGALGFSLLGNVIPVFKRKSQEIIMRMLGYPKFLIKKSIEKSD